MKTLISAILLAAPIFAEAADYSEFVKKWEGVKTKVYTDTAGKRTIGIGINIDDPSAEGKLKRFGISVSSLLNGKSLTYSQIHGLFQQELAIAIVTAKETFPSFDSQPAIVKQIMVDLCYNLGENKIKGFVKFKAAVERKDYKTASAELVDSKWYTQTGRRAKHHVTAIKYAGLQ